MFCIHVRSTYTFDDSRSHYPSTTPSRTLYYHAHLFSCEIRWIHSFNKMYSKIKVLIELLFKQLSSTTHTHLSEIL
ncbi:hypothetical protein Hanom_Chr04g00317621 [Helianthus anomalus]